MALSGVSVEVPEGTIGLVGANGAGKTTLLKILLGILSPASGSVVVLDSPVEREPDRRSIQGGVHAGGTMLAQGPDGSRLRGLHRRAGRAPPVKRRGKRASDVLGLVGLHEERFRTIGEFSTGMAQRTKLAQAIVHHPELVLLDEPTAGLDPEGREDMLSLISRLAGFGISVIVSSHVLTDIEQTCDWVVMLDGGQGPPIRPDLGARSDRNHRGRAAR